MMINISCLKIKKYFVNVKEVFYFFIVFIIHLNPCLLKCVWIPSSLLRWNTSPLLKVKELISHNWDNEKCLIVLQHFKLISLISTYYPTISRSSTSLYSEGGVYPNQDTLETVMLPLLFITAQHTCWPALYSHSVTLAQLARRSHKIAADVEDGGIVSPLFIGDEWGAVVNVWIQLVALLHFSAARTLLFANNLVTDINSWAYFVRRCIFPLCLLVGMRILVTLLLDTLPMLGNVLALCFFVFFIFGIVGVQLWAGLLRNRCFMGEEVKM